MFEHIRKEGNFMLSSGRKSNYFYDFDLLLPREHLDATATLRAKLGKIKVDHIVAPAIGGIIPGFILAGALNIKLSVVDHHGFIRGKKPLGKYLIIDDVISSFKTIKRIHNICGKDCIGAVAYLFRGNNKDLKEGQEKYDVLYFLERKEIEE